MTTRIGIFVFEGAEELDWVGPYEVLKVWEMYYDDDVEVFTVAPTRGPLTCGKGLKIIPDHTWHDAPPIDVLVYPGGIGTRQHIGDESYRKWLRGLHDSGTLVTSVCTGGLVLADAGLLDGRPATTHWGYVMRLTELGTNVQPRAQDRYVDDGDIITAAGVSAGIDMALYLICRLASRERAVEVRRYIQYDPAPPV